MEKFQKFQIFTEKWQENFLYNNLDKRDIKIIRWENVNFVKWLLESFKEYSEIVNDFQRTYFDIISFGCSDMDPAVICNFGISCQFTLVENNPFNEMY